VTHDDSAAKNVVVLAAGEASSEGTKLSARRRKLLARGTKLPTRYAHERLGSAGREELESWAERVLEAASIEDVFGA
jgi:hypothetical protein